MPLDTSIPLQAKVPESNPLATLLQVGQYKYLQQNSNRLQQETDAQNALGQLIQKNTGADGNVNMQGVMADAANTPAAAYGMKDYVGTNLSNQGQQITNQGGQIKNASDAFTLQKDYMGTALQTASGLAGDPRINAPAGQYNDKAAAGALTEGFNQMVSKGVPVDQALLAVSPYMNAIHTPGAVAQMLRNTTAGQLSPQGQVSAATPSIATVSDNQTSKGINFNPYAGAVGSTVPGTEVQLKLPASQLETVGQDPNGNPTVTTKDPSGRVIGVSGAPVQGQQSVPPRVIPSTETPQSYADLQAQRDQVNKAAGQVQTQHFNNRSIIDILDKDHLIDPTGSNAQWLSKASSAVGLPISGKFAEDYNQINHYLAMQKQANEKAMGVNTDAGRGTAEAASGSSSMDPVSLRKAVAINDATSSGLAAYNEGQEAAAKKGGIPALRDFQNAWSKYYDVNAMRMLNAYKNGDQKEADDVMKSLGGKDSLKFKTMRNNAQKLDQLQRGIIPNGGQ